MSSQEISRGMHPAVLSRGGLGPAIKMLARRSTVPVELELAVDQRLPEYAEVAAYYVLAEALRTRPNTRRPPRCGVSCGVDGANCA